MQSRAEIEMKKIYDKIKRLEKRAIGEEIKCDMKSTIDERWNEENFAVALWIKMCTNNVALEVSTMI